MDALEKYLVNQHMEDEHVPQDFKDNLASSLLPRKCEKKLIVMSNPSSPESHFESRFMDGVS